MATKKKSDVIMSADIAESLENKWPQIKKGNHLTVKTFENGHTVLEWDDEALTREVTNAILSVNQQENEDGNSKIGK